MRTASLRSGATPFGRISEVTAEFAQLRRIKAPEQAEVVAVHGDDDWFALFADEKDLAPRTGRRRGPIERAPSERAQISPTKPTEIAARDAQPVIEAWEFNRFAPEEDPAWLRRVLNWRLAPWSAIATGIVLAAGVLLVVARSLGGDGTSAATETTVSSVSAETGIAATPWPALTQSVAYAPSTSTPSATPAPRKAATPTKAAPPPSSARPTPAVRPTPIRATAPTPTPTPAPVSTPKPPAASTPNPASASSLSAAPPTTRIDATPSPVVAPTTSAPSPAPSQPSDSVLIRSLLDHYRQAYGSLDADAVAAVWPSVNTRSLARAFSQLESQRFEFADCRIDVSVERAQAICSGRASFVPKIGGQTTRTVNREWAFVLQRLNDGWIISRADAR